MDVVKKLCDEPQALLALIVVLVFIVVFMIYKYLKTVTEFLYGMWYGDEEFCDKANISNMYLYIGAQQSLLNPTRNGYLLIYDVDEIIDNTKLQITFMPFTVTMKRPVDTNAPVDPQTLKMPEKLSYNLNLAEGTLKLYDSVTKKVYACLVKDNVMTKFLDAELAAAATTTSA